MGIDSEMAGQRQHSCVLAGTIVVNGRAARTLAQEGKARVFVVGPVGAALI